MNKVTVAGLGSGNIDLLPNKTYSIFKAGKDDIFLRTERHPAALDLANNGISFKSFDYLYDQADSFDEVYNLIVEILIDKSKKQEVIYAVPGHPLVGEKSVEILLEKEKENSAVVDIIPAMSCLDAVFTALRIDPVQEGIVVCDCLDLHEAEIDTGKPLILTQLYNTRIASEVKLSLMECYPDEFPVKIVKAAGVPSEERLEEVSLYEIDRLNWIDHLTTLYVPADNSCREENSARKLNELESVMAKLRGDNGCPWDKQQTHQSLKRYLIEETYEVIEAIEEKKMNKLEEELGDLLLQIVFHAQIAKENSEFEISSVIGGITEKLLRRHPHVFGSTEVESVEEVNANWEQIKRKEKKDRPRFDIPKSLPALMRAVKVQEKAGEVGFDWTDIRGIWAKIDEEINELHEAVSRENHIDIVSEIGDLLFTIVNAARFLNVEPEEALSGTVEKFIERFSYMEKIIEERGELPQNLSLEELDELWEESKAKNI